MEVLKNFFQQLKSQISTLNPKNNTVLEIPVDCFYNSPSFRELITKLYNSEEDHSIKSGEYSGKLLTKNIKGSNISDFDSFNYDSKLLLQYTTCNEFLVRFNGRVISDKGIMIILNPEDTITKHLEEMGFDHILVEDKIVFFAI